MKYFDYCLVSELRCALSLKYVLDFKDIAQKIQNISLITLILA